jgi:hypothetical protein
MSDITDTFYSTSYYVDNQGLYIDASETFKSDAASLTFNAGAGYGSISAMVSARPAAAPGGEDSFILSTGGADELTVSYASGTSLSVTLDGVTQTFTGIGDFSDDWLTYGVSV